MSLASYYFVPSVRHGLAAAISEPASGARASIDVQIHVRAAASSGEVTSAKVSKAVQLFGPGDVTGFQRHAVVRSDPRANVDDFEPNYFPFVELADPDFAWRFTPAPANVAGKLLPWITLVVLLARDTPDDEQPEGWKRAEFELGDREQTGGTPWIRVSTEFLPDLSQSWRWAHVQVTEPEGRSAAQLSQTIEHHPERAVARIMCPRRLRPRARYRAFLVPTFAPGVVAAGLGQASPALSGVTLAWDKSAGASVVELPYYYDWEFGTGTRGDFEHLVRLLEARSLAGLGVGRRNIDCSQPGYGLPGADLGHTPLGDQPDAPHELGLEGALRSPDTQLSAWGADAADERGTSFRRQFAAEVLNHPLTVLTQGGVTASGPVSRLRITSLSDEARIAWASEQPSTSRIEYGKTDALGQVAEAPSGALLVEHVVTIPAVDPATIYHFRVASQDAAGDPVTSEVIAFVPLPAVVPPIYGRWHAARQEVDESGDSRHWLDELNLDPRHRVAAGFGEQTIREQQEPLMAEAWRQLGEVEAANELLRNGQLGRAASTGYYERLTSLVGAGTSAGEMESFLNLCRPMHHRIVAPISDEADAPAVVVREHLARVGDAVMDRTLQRVRRPRGPIRKRQQPGTPQLRGKLVERLNTGSLAAASAQVEPQGMVGFGHVMKELLPELDHAGPSDYGITSSALATALGSSSTLDGMELPSMLQQPEAIEGGIGVVVDEWLNATAQIPVPAEADLSRVGDALVQALNPRNTIVARVHARIVMREIGRGGDPLAPILAAPDFPQPMYEGLRDASGNRVLPGIEKVPRNTVSLLMTNRRFIEAYLCGCNHAFAAELLWREFPTDQRGSYFRQFWDVMGFVPTSSQLAIWRADVEATVPASTEDRDAVIEERLTAAIARRLEDIPPIHHWDASRLGEHPNPEGAALRENLVLLVRGDLFRKYPNALVYAVKAREVNGRRVPDLSEHLGGLGVDEEPVFPLFAGDLPPETNFFGFPFTEEDARSGGGDLGLYFVLEQRVSEARFGMDVPSLASGSPTQPTVWTGSDEAANLADWADLNWGLTAADSYIDEHAPKQEALPAGQPNWNTSAATIAWITVQRPIRLAIHADQMLP